MLLDGIFLAAAIGTACFIFISVGWIVAEFIIWPEFLYYIFWTGRNPNSFIFRRFIEKNDRVHKLFLEVCEVAVAKGFEFRYPRIWITKSWVKPSFYFAIAYSPSNNIVINSVSLKLFDDSALSALIAHELGHIIDFQTGRKKHPFFIEANILGLKDAEDIAWALAIYITSREIVEYYFSTKHNLYL